MSSRQSGPDSLSVAQSQQYPVGVGAEPNIFNKYLSPTGGTQPLNPFQNTPIPNVDLKDRFTDQVYRLEEVVRGFLLEPSSWITSIYLPWVQTDQLNIEWHEFWFNRPLAGIVPEEGISRLVTTGKKLHRGRMRRRGLAFQMEAGDAETEAGRETIRRNIRGISDSIQITQEYDTILTTMTKKNKEADWQYKYGTLDVSYETILQDEIEQYAIASKTQMGMRIYYEKLRAIMIANDVTPNIFAGPPGSKIFLSLTDPQKIDYWLAGPEGQALRRDGPRSQGTMEDGTPFYETRPFTVQDNGPKAQLLNRRTNVAEYYKMLNIDFKANKTKLWNFETYQRNTPIYDQDADDWRVISFRDAFCHAKLFDNEGCYSKVLTDLEERYRIEGRKLPISSSDVMSDRDGRGASAGASWRKGAAKDDPMDPIHFLFSSNDEGEPKLIRYMGQMSYEAASRGDFEDVGTTILSNIFKNYDALAAARDDYLDLIRLIGDIEGQPYHHQYWVDLVATNEEYSVDSNGKFVGDFTPDDLLAYWPPGEKMGTRALREWTPNSAGSLELPQPAGDRTYGGVFPAGFANLPGLRTLAREANKDKSVWRSMGERADKAVALVDIIVDSLKKIPTCEAISEHNRPPWFHKPDASAVLFSNLISTNRDPVWLAVLPPIKGPGGTVPGAMAGEEMMDGTDTELQWTVIPVLLYRPGTSLGEVETSKLMIDLQQIYKGDAGNVLGDLQALGDTEPTDRTSVAYYSPLAGTTVRIPRGMLNHAAVIPKDLKALLLMGEKSIDDYKLVLSTIQGIPDSDLDPAKKSMYATVFVRWIYDMNVSGTLNKQQLRKIVTRISFDRADSSRMLEVINLLGAIEGDKPEKIENAKAMMKDLKRDISGYDDDPDLQLVKDLKLFEPKGFRDLESEATNFLAYSEVQQQLDELYRLVGEANLAAYGAGLPPGTNVIPAFGFSNSDFALWSAAATGAGTALLGQVSAIRTQIVNRLAPEQNVDQWGRGAADRYSSKKSKLTVHDEPTAGITSEYKRSPLTMSFDLLRSANQYGPGAVIRPSDPTTAHTMYYVPENYSTERPTARGTKQLLPDSIWRRPEYAHIGKINKSSSSSSDPEETRQLDQLTFLSRHTMASSSHDGNHSEDHVPSDGEEWGANSGGDDDDDYKLSQVFGNSRENNRFRKSGGRSRTATTSTSSTIGGHYDGGSRGKRKWGQDKRERWGKSMLSDPEALSHWKLPFDQQGTRYRDSGLYIKTHTGIFKKRFHESNGITDPLHRIVVQAFMLTRADMGQSWLHMMDNNILVPVNLILWRHRIEHHTSSFLLARGGQDTGANYTGHANLAWGSDVNTKMILANMTFYAKAIITKPDNISILEDAIPSEYAGGNNTRFVVDPTDVMSKEKNRPSIIVTAIPISENKLPWMMDLSGVPQIPTENEALDGVLRPSYSTWEFYDMVYNFSTYANTMSQKGEYFYDAGKRFNTIALQGHQFLFNLSDRLFSRVVYCQGHRGKNGSYPGAKKVWNGGMMIFEDYNFEDVKIS